MIHVCEPLITARDIELVNDALASGWISFAGKLLHNRRDGETKPVSYSINRMDRTT